MSILLASWNMQGGGCWSTEAQTTHSDKYISLIDFLGFHHIVAGGIEGYIIMLQETGNPEAVGFSTGTNYGSLTCLKSKIDDTALAIRCTTSILISNNLLTSGVISDIRELSLQGYRPALYFSFTNTAGNKIGFATLHAIATTASSVSQVKNYIHHFNNFDDVAIQNSWIFVGDFNSDPDDTHNYQSDRLYYDANNTKCRHYNDRIYGAYDMVYSDIGTQGALGINWHRPHKLDFMIFADNTAVTRMNINGQLHNEVMTDRRGGPLSDHNLIWAEINV